MTEENLYGLNQLRVKSYGKIFCSLQRDDSLLLDLSWGSHQHTISPYLDNPNTNNHSPEVDTLGGFFLRQTTEILIAYTQA